MITFKKIRIAVNNKLKQVFNLPINSSDVTEGFLRPSFFVEFDEVNRTGLESQIEKSLIVRIYYFPTSTEKASIEILDMQEELPNAFDTHLSVEDRQLHINTTNSTVSDGVLQFEFEMVFEDGRESTDDAEFMKEIDIEIQKG